VRSSGKSAFDPASAWSTIGFVSESIGFPGGRGKRILLFILFESGQRDSAVQPQQGV